MRHMLNHLGISGSNLRVTKKKQQRKHRLRNQNQIAMCTDLRVVMAMEGLGTEKAMGTGRCMLVELAQI